MRKCQREPIRMKSERVKHLMSEEEPQYDRKLRQRKSHSEIWFFNEKTVPKKKWQEGRPRKKPERNQQ